MEGMKRVWKFTKWPAGENAAAQQFCQTAAGLRTTGTLTAKKRAPMMVTNVDYLVAGGVWKVWAERRMS